MNYPYLRPCAPGTGEGVRAVVAEYAEHGRVNQLVIDDPGPGHPPDLFGDRILPNGRDADKVDDGVVKSHIRKRFLQRIMKGRPFGSSFRVADAWKITYRKEN